MEKTYTLLWYAQVTAEAQTLTANNGCGDQGGDFADENDLGIKIMTFMMITMILSHPGINACRENPPNVAPITTQLTLALCAPAIHCNPSSSL